MAAPEFAPAKINLALHVTGQRGDGYHELDMLVAFADVGDRLTLAPAPRDSLVVKGPFAEGLADVLQAGNLVVKAIDAFRAAFGGASVHAILEKTLPPASGIGGGSADAAAALRAMNRLRPGGPLPLDALLPVAQSLGADVPMCLVSSPLRARGTGERLDALTGLPLLHAVLVNPGMPVATPAVFNALSRRDNAPLPSPLVMPEEGAALAGWLGENTRNDLQDAAVSLCPVIADCLSALSGNGAQLSRMSGSGATCFGLFSSRNAAESAASAISARNPGWWCRATVLSGSPEQGKP